MKYLLILLLVLTGSAYAQEPVRINIKVTTPTPAPTFEQQFPALANRPMTGYYEPLVDTSMALSQTEFQRLLDPFGINTTKKVVPATRHKITDVKKKSSR